MLSEDFVAPQIKSTFLINSGASCRGEALPLFSSFLLTSLLFDGKKHRIKGSFTHARAAKRENRAKVTLVWIWWPERSSRRAQASFTAWWFNLSDSCGQCTPLLWGIILLPRRIKTRAGVLWVESLTVEAEPACDFKVMRTLFKDSSGAFCLSEGWTGIFLLFFLSCVLPFMGRSDREADDLLTFPSN